MRFRIIGLLNLTVLALMGFYEGPDSSKSSEIQKPLMQFRSGTEIGHALTVRRNLRTVPVLNPADSRTFVLNRISSETLAAQNKEKRKDFNYQLRKIEEWRDASVQHNPGEPDAAAVMTGRWDEEDLELVVRFVTKLATQSAKTARRKLASASLRRILRLTDQEVRRGDLNRILKQGALLLTDVAMLGLETNRNFATGNPMAAIEDGCVAVLPKARNWEFARRLIDSISPSPSQDPMVRQWYIATTAYMQSRGLLSYAEQNIENALKIFPSNNRILFYAGALHEIWASPRHQNILLPPKIEVTFGSEKSELKQARQFFRKAIEANPNFAETHLRLGRVQGLLGNHSQAVAELQLAAASLKDPQLLYYTSLYLGLEYSMISRKSEAREQYERAAVLYPTAQSPLFALSQLANRCGDMEGASFAVERVFVLPRADSRKDDPWWIYNLSHVRDADTLVADMREMFGRLPR